MTRLLAKEDLPLLLAQLASLPRETEWVEFKQNNCDPDEVGEYISALANSAKLSKVEMAYLVWGVEDETHELVGTSVHPGKKKIGNENLEAWLARLLEPRIPFRIYEFRFEGKQFVILAIPAATHTPVRFKDGRYIRVGSYKKNLRDYPERERLLWASSSHQPFEARGGLINA